MKLIIRTFACIILLSTLCPMAMKSQDDDYPKWAVAANGGLNISNKHNDELWGTNTGYHIGVLVDYTLVDYLFIRSGVRYTTKGANWSRSVQTSFVNAQNDLYIQKEKNKVGYDLGYLHIPLSLGVRIQTTDNFAFSIIVGIYGERGVSFKSTNTSELRLTQISDNTTEITKNKSTNTDWDNSYLKRTDMGASISIETDYKRLTFGANYERGMRNINVKSSNNKRFNKWNNRNLALSVGYKFFVK